MILFCLYPQSGTMQPPTLLKQLAVRPKSLRVKLRTEAGTLPKHYLLTAKILYFFENKKKKSKEFLVTSYQFVKSDALDASTETPGLNVRNDSDIAKVLQGIVLPKKILQKLQMRTENLWQFITEIERGKCLIELDRITTPFIQKNFTILNNKEHYVRTTIKSQKRKKQARIHSLQQKLIYMKNPLMVCRLPNFPSGEIDHQWIIDAKLQQFFEYAN